MFHEANACLAAGSVSSLLTQADFGEAGWWQRISQIGTPLRENAEDGLIRMHYFWRDTQGDTRQVYIDINGVTDHHSISPQSLVRMGNSDVWHWSTLIDADWRGSYSLIPITTTHLPPVFSSDEAIRRQQQRAWWISLMPLAQADPLNPRQPLRGSNRVALSNAQMPAAPDQSAWQTFDEGQSENTPSTLRCLSWHSRLLGITRNVWLYTSGESHQPTQRPLVILLDGQNWVQGQPIFSALETETSAGRLPPACWLFIDAIDGKHREAELPCNELFWQAVTRELIPLARQHVAFSDQGDRTLVAGQSYGGLAALYAGLHWPQRFGRILSQSGSFWWPHLDYILKPEQADQHPPGLLWQRLQQGTLPPGRLTIFQEVGEREPDMLYVNQQLVPALQQAGHHLHFRRYNGGHDALCWRGGLIDGCRWLLADFLTTELPFDVG